MQSVSQFVERPVRQLATNFAQRGAFSERTNEMAAVAHPVGMEVVTARCKNSGEERRRYKEINRRAKVVIQARQKKAEEDAARAAHNGEVVRQSAAEAAEKGEKKRQRQAEKNKQRRKKMKMKKIHKEWQKEAEDDEWAEQSNAMVEEEAVLVAVQWRTRQAVRALRAVRWQQQMQELSEWKAEQFGGVRVQLGRSWCVWRQRCSAPDTSVSGDQKMPLTEETTEEDAEADSWTEVMAAVGMAANAADSRAKAGAVQAENPLFQSMGTEEAATAAVAAAAAAEATMGMARLAAATAEEDITSQKTAEQTAIREHNPLFQSMGTGEAVMAVANRVEEVAAVEMAVTASQAAADATAEMDEDTTEAEEAEYVAAAPEAAAQEEAEIGGGASGRQIWDQSRMFDPGIFFGIFPNLMGTNFKIWRAKELDIIWFSQVTVYS
jgi:hypothetical protein